MEDQLGTGSGATPEVRVSEEERDKAAADLAKYCSEGRLTLDEFSQRVEAVLAARTQTDIDRVMADLPKGGAVAAYASPVPQSGWFVSVLSGSSRTGRWRPRPRIKAFALLGGVDMDLRNAEIEGSELTITAIAIMGGIDIVVPEGVIVHLGGFSLLGGKDVKLANVPTLPGAPVINVRAFPIMGGVKVRTKRSRTRLIDAVNQMLPPAAGAGPGALGDRPMVGTRGGIAAGRPKGSKGSKADRQREQILGARDALVLAGDILNHLSERAAAGRAAGTAGDRRPAAPDGTVTILFSDVSGFTEITEQLGDGASQELLATYFQIVRGQVATHGGYEVKCHADEAMLAFSGAGQAVRCAIDIQRSLSRYNEQHPDAPIRAHIGLHTGEAIQDGGDFLGRTVILASRITDEAGSEEILVSSLLHELTANSPDLVFAPARTVALQGVSDPQTLFPVLWT
jgi:class 3 adenylate cyclase